MEENNRIKIKTNVIYSIVMLFVIVMGAYCEVLVVKKTVGCNMGEMWGSILVIFYLT